MKKPLYSNLFCLIIFDFHPNVPKMKKLPSCLQRKSSWTIPLVSRGFLLASRGIVFLRRADLSFCGKRKILLKQEYKSFCSKRTGPLEARGFFFDKFIKSYKYLKILKILQTLEFFYIYINFLKKKWKTRFLSFFCSFFHLANNWVFHFKKIIPLEARDYFFQCTYGKFFLKGLLTFGLSKRWLWF